MRGRRPFGPEYVEHLSGSATAKQRAKVILETMMGNCRVLEACQQLGIGEQRFHQLREQMMVAALKALEPGHAGRPARTVTPAEKQVAALEQQLADKEVDLRTAMACEEIALIMPEVVQEPAVPEKKTPQRPAKHRRRGRKKNT